ncbi:MAG TPA: hypothetical protein VF993_12375, partial [Myxococcales bacterium]
MRELSQSPGPIVVLTDDPASAIEGGADDAGGTEEEVALRVAARSKTPRGPRKETEERANEAMPVTAGGK